MYLEKELENRVFNYFHYPFVCVVYKAKHILKSNIISFTTYLYSLKF